MHYIDTYKEIKKLKPKGIRGSMRSLALTGLSMLEKTRGMDTQLQKPRIQLLYIHHIFKDEEQKLHLLLKTLQKHHTFISHSEAVDRILHRKIDKPYIALSSDDGFKNNLSAGRIFAQYGVKACFFVNPGLIGESDFERIATHCKTKLHLPPLEFLSWNDVEALQNMGHEIGSHTMQHMNVSEATDTQIVEDMQMTYDILQNQCGNVQHFAFPYGRFRHFNATGKKACFAAGFRSCATAERGCHINHDRDLQHNELCILRDHVVLDWKIDHILYFLTRNARNADSSSNLFPY